MKKLFLIFLFLCLATVSADAANRFAVCTATCTWDGASTAMWSTTTGGATGASVPGASDAVILDGATCVGGITCTITVNANLNISSLTMGACTASTTGCILDFSANNNSFAATTVSLTGTGTRTLKMGSGTWTITGTGTLWTLATATNMTLTPGSSNLVLQANGIASGTFTTANGVTYGHITINAMVNNASAGLMFFSANTFTINTLDIQPFNYITFQNATVTITNPITWTGNSSNGVRVNDLTATVAAGSTMKFAALFNTHWTGAPVATASFDEGQNSGITITNSGGGGCILGGWLLWRDFHENLNDNFPAWLEKAA